MDPNAGLYQFGYVLVQYIVEEYGYDKLIALLKTPDVPAIFEMTEEEFHEKWSNFLARTYL